MNSVLRSIEFPGEDDAAIARYLDRMNVAEVVLNQTRRKVKRMKTFHWWLFLFVVNALILFCFSTNSLHIQNYFVFHNIFKTIIFISLSSTLFGTMIGAVLNMDTRWMRRYVQVD